MIRSLILILLALAGFAGEADPRISRLVDTYSGEMAKIEEARASAVQKADDARTAGAAKARSTAITGLKRLVSNRSEFAAQAEVYKAVLRIDREDADASRFFTAIGTLDQVLAEVDTKATDALGEPLSTPTDPKQGYVEALPESAFTASSVYNPTHAAHFAKFSMTTTFANWSALTMDTKQWLQIDLGRTQPIGIVATMGRAGIAQWVTSYRLQGSLDGTTWTAIPNVKGGDDFTANSDQVTVVAHRMPAGLRARYIRFLPQTWSAHISMRVEIYPPR